MRNIFKVIISVIMFVLGIVLGIVFPIDVLLDHTPVTIKKSVYQLPKTPAFVYCVEGGTALVYDHSTGPITLLDDGYLTFETRDGIIRVDGRNCRIEWRK